MKFMFLLYAQPYLSDNIKTVVYMDFLILIKLCCIGYYNEDETRDGGGVGFKYSPFWINRNDG